MDGVHPRPWAWIPDTALATSQARVFWRRDARHGGPGHLRAPFGLTAAPEDALRAQLDPGCLPLRPPSVSMGLGLADEALRSAPRCGRTARAARPPPPSGRSRSGRGRSPSRRSSPPFPAGSSATTARPRPAVRACGGSWPGCRQRVELEAHRVGPEGRARQPRPLDRVLALLDVLLRRAAAVVEGDDLLGRATQVRHDEADARVQLAGMPLDLRDHPTRPAPALRPIAEARIEASDIVRGALDGPREQRRDLRLEQAGESCTGSPPPPGTRTHPGARRLHHRAAVGEGPGHDTAPPPGRAPSRQPCALGTLPARSAHRSRSPSWLNTNSG